MIFSFLRMLKSYYFRRVSLKEIYKIPKELMIELMTEQIKVRFSNFGDVNNSFFIAPLNKIFRQNDMFYKEIKYSKADIEFFSVFGYKRFLEKSKSSYKIFFTGENVNSGGVVDTYRQYAGNCTEYVDLAMGFDFIDVDNYLRLPLWIPWYFQPYDSKDDIKRKLQSFTCFFERRTKFCSMIARHDTTKLRSKICQDVSRIAHVDCPGKLLHNDDTLWQQFADNKDQYLRQYKFNICPENSIGNGYVTEKLFQAWNAGCIPIYNGYSKDPEPGILNPKVFLWYEPDGDNTDMLNRIRELNADEKKYKEFISQQFFMDTAVDKIYNYLHNYCERMERIAEQIVQEKR